MIGINGNDPLFGFGGGNKKVKGNNNQQPQVNNDVPVGKPKEVAPAPSAAPIEASALDVTAAQMLGVHFAQQPNQKLTPESVTLTPEELKIATEMAASPEMAMLAEETGAPNAPLNNIVLHQLRHDTDGNNVPIDLNKLSEYLDTAYLNEATASGLAEYMDTLMA